MSETLKIEPAENSSHSAANPKMISRCKANANPLMTYATRREVRDTTAFANLNPVTDSAVSTRGNSMPRGNKMVGGKTDNKNRTRQQANRLVNVGEQQACDHGVGKRYSPQPFCRSLGRPCVVIRKVFHKSAPRVPRRRKRDYLRLVFGCLRRYSSREICTCHLNWA